MSKKKKTINFIDQTSEFDHHMVFNASMLKILYLIFPNTNLISYGLASNIKSVKTLLNNEELSHIQFQNIQHKKVEGSKLKKALNYLRKEWYRVKNFHYILSTSKEEDWLVLSITTFTSFLWFKILKTFYKTNVIAVLHGDVDFVYNASNKYEKLNGFVHKLIFKIKAKNFYYLTLNKIEKKFLVEDGWLKQDEVFEIEHPFLNIKEDTNTKTEPNETLTLGHIGSMEVKRKNSHFIFNLAEMCKNLIYNNKVIFKSIGLMTPSMLPYKNNYVDVIVGNEQEDKPKYLTREQYETGLNSLDYILFFYPKKEYVFRASGAIPDFLAKNKPIICLKHPIFEYMFKKGGDIGFMCDSLEEIQQLIEKITQPEFNLNAQYQNQVDNIKKYKQNFDIINVAEDLKNQISTR